MLLEKIYFPAKKLQQVKSATTAICQDFLQLILCLDGGGWMVGRGTGGKRKGELVIFPRFLGFVCLLLVLLAVGGSSLLHEESKLVFARQFGRLRLLKLFHRFTRRGLTAATRFIPRKENIHKKFVQEMK